MSTIEEAREQAREAMSKLVGILAEKGGRKTDAEHLLEAAVCALLDATEPPAPLSIEDFITGTTDGEVDTDEFFADLDERPAEPMRDADGDMISSGEHRKISMSGDSFFVCDTCTNVLGLNVRWDHASKREDHQAAVESLPDKPAEDEREALVMTLYANGLAGNLHEPLRRQAVEKWADAILADGYSKGPRPITDEMVEAAAREYHERGNGERSFARASGHVRTSLLFRMKCALGAAEEARR